MTNCADRPDLSGGIIQLSQVLEKEYRKIDWEKIEEYFERWGGGTMVKRIGYRVELLDLPIPEREYRINRWQALITEGNSLLEPGAGKGGPTVRSWQIRVNVRGLPSMRAG